jgi:hypothetical protein
MGWLRSSCWWDACSRSSVWIWVWDGISCNWVPQYLDDWYSTFTLNHHLWSHRWGLKSFPHPHIRTSILKKWLRHFKSIKLDQLGPSSQAWVYQCLKLPPVVSWLSGEDSKFKGYSQGEGGKLKPRRDFETSKHPASNSREMKHESKDFTPIPEVSHVFSWTMDHDGPCSS